MLYSRQNLGLIYISELIIVKMVCYDNLIFLTLKDRALMIIKDILRRINSKLTSNFHQTLLNSVTFIVDILLIIF